MRKIRRFLAVLFFIGCSTVPITGRKQLSFIPQGDLMTLSDQGYKDVLSNSTLSTDVASKQKVVEVGQKISASAETFMRENGMEKDLARYKWEINLIEDSKTVNAFCMPEERSWFIREFFLWLGTKTVSRR